MARKFERTKQTFDIYGEVVTCDTPSVGAVEAVLEEISNAEAKNARKIWCDFMIPLGFKKEQLDSLEPEHFGDLVDDLMGVKKKSQPGS
jgi:hypothetical protein